MCARLYLEGGKGERWKLKVHYVKHERLLFFFVCLQPYLERSSEWCVIGRRGVLVLVMFAHNNFEKWCLWKEMYHNWRIHRCWLPVGCNSEHVLLLVCVEIVNLVCMHVHTLLLHSHAPLSFIGEIG